MYNKPLLLLRSKDCAFSLFNPAPPSNPFTAAILDLASVIYFFQGKDLPVGSSHYEGTSRCVSVDLALYPPFLEVFMHCNAYSL
jgi:hypothetical protein